MLFGRSLKALMERSAQELGRTDAEGATRATGPGSDAPSSARPRPPEVLSWTDVNQLCSNDPAAFSQKWEEMLKGARAELRDGTRSVATLSDVCATSPWRLARFFAVREELSADWLPQNGVERLLVDDLAQSYTLSVFCREIVAALIAQFQSTSRRGLGGEEPPPPGDPEELEQAMQMLERHHAMYVRTLKALQDARRARPAVVVGRAGQVNVAEHQVNYNNCSNG
jgi:hypothetical protein